MRSAGTNHKSLHESMHQYKMHGCKAHQCKMHQHKAHQCKLHECNMHEGKEHECIKHSIVWCTEVAAMSALIGSELPEKSNKRCIVTPAVSVHIPQLQGNVPDSIPDCQPAAKIGKDPLLHQELVNDGEDKTNEDEEHEGDSNGEDDEGDLFSKVEDNPCCITGGHRGHMQQ